MTSVHPAFDVETRTWFVTTPRNAEAPTIRALLEKLGPGFTAEGYRPADGPPIVIKHEKVSEVTRLRPESPAIQNIGRPKYKRIPPMPLAVIDAVKLPLVDKPPQQPRVKIAPVCQPTPKPAPEPPRQVDASPVLPKRMQEAIAASAAAAVAAAEQIREWERQIKAQVDVDLLKIKRRSPVQVYPKPAREPRRAERRAWSDRENAALDAWAAGENGVAIARRLGMSHAQVAARLVPNARKRGDPRAVVRNQKKFGHRMTRGCTA